MRKGLKKMTVMATVAAAMTMTTGTVAQAADVNLTVAYADAEDSVFGKGVTAFSEKLDELSGGTMACDIFPNGTLGSVTEVAEMVVTNNGCDIEPVVTSSLTSYCPSLGVFDLPFLFADYEAAKTAVDGEAGATLAAELENYNIKVGSWMTMGFREVTSNKEIKEVADFEGLKIRTQQNDVHMDIFEALGASPTIISFSELYTALEQGTVDAQENPYVNIYNNAYYDVQDYLIETNHVFQMAAFAINKTTYDSLTEEQQGWVDEASAYAAEVEWAATQEDNEKAKQQCVDAGMNLVTLDHEELLEATQSVYDEYSGQYGDLVEMINK